MRKLKTWVYVFKRSAFDPEYYADILKVKFSFSLKYLFFLLFLITLFQSARVALWAFTLGPSLGPKISVIKQNLKDDYPKNLLITVKNGEVRTNQAEPVRINYVKLRRTLDFPQDSNFITIDTSGKAEDFPKYNTLFLVTKTAVVYPKKDSSKTTFELTQLDKSTNFLLDQSSYEVYLSKILPYLDVVPKLLTIFGIALLVLFPFLGAYSATGGKLFYLLVMTLVVLLLAKWMKKDIGYKKLFQLGVHAVTLPTLVTFLLGFFLKSPIPWLYTGIFLVWIITILTKLQTVKK